MVAKLGERRRWTRGVDAVDLIAAGQVDLVVNSPRVAGPEPTAPTSGRGRGPSVPLLTTAAAALAAAHGMADWARHPLRVRSLQDYQRGG